MPTTVTKLIGSGGDYTTLQSWEDACPANLVSSDQIWRGEIKASTDVFTAAVNISGTTVDSTRYVELTTATGASFRDNASVQSNALRYNASNGCAINFASNYAEAITIAQNYTRVSNIQVQCTATNGNPLGINTFTGTDVNNMIIESNNPNQTVSLVTCGPIRNSLIVCRRSSATNIAIIKASSAYNCTFVVPSDKTAASRGIDHHYFTATLVNCAIFGATLADRDSDNSLGTTCYTNQASPPTGFTTATYNTSQFVNITDATRDFRLPSGSAMIDHGTTDSTNAPTDIAGTSRPSGSSYDVGCWEYVSAAAAYVAKKMVLVMQSVNRSASY